MYHYYLLNWHPPCRYIDRASLPRVPKWWNDGVIFTTPPVTPLKAVLEPYDATDPEQSPNASPLYLSRIPLMRDDLVKAFQEAGVDNFELFDAQIKDPDNGKIYTNYKAVNIVGMLQAADMGKSIAEIPDDGIALINTSFDELHLDSSKTRGFPMFRLAENNNAICVIDRVAEHVKLKNFPNVRFYETHEMAL